MANFRDIRNLINENKDRFKKIDKLINDEKLLEESNERNKIANKLLNIRDNIPLQNSKLLNETFDETLFEKKVKSDYVIYNFFLNKIDNDKLKSKAKNFIKVIYEGCNQIYNMTDINPKIVIKEIDADRDSNEVIQEYSRKYISENLEYEYYSLDKTQKEKKYLNKIIFEFEEVSKYITKEEDIQDAVVTIQKKLVLNKLIHRIVFPFITESRIDDFINDHRIDEIFDKEKIMLIKEDVEKNIEHLSKIFAESV